MNNLPIYEVLDELKLKLKHENRVILQATTGSGKSTVIPISLLKEDYLKNKKIIVLEPRRLAARVIAKQLAKNLNENVGKTVGYQVKLDSCFSKETKILVITEALLIRKIQSNQSIDDIGLIIFDEFHERSIHTDLTLAFSLQIQEFLREDLKLLIMSATLNSEKLSEFLNASIITSIAKNYDVKNIYLPKDIRQPKYEDVSLVIETIYKALTYTNKNILVFLHGQKQIIEVKNSLNISKDILVLPLYSNLNKKLQDLAISKQNKRKIILATNVAQTSLTIEDVNVVIDSGLEKVSRYDSSTGLNYLELSFISKESALQRQGRAGRLENGICYKLWHESKILDETLKPEILRTDLTQTLLELSLWQINSFDDLKWIDKPNEISITHAKELLVNLNMMDENYKITSFGQKAIKLGIHPRFAYMILKANQLGFAYEASILASIFNENGINNDIFSFFIDCYEKQKNANILKEANLYIKKLKEVESINKKTFSYDLLGVLALFAYPDRLGKIREKDDIRYKLSNNKGAKLSKDNILFNEDFLVAINVNTNNIDSFIINAFKINLNDIYKYFSFYIKEEENIIFDKKNNKLQSRKTKYFLNLELDITPCKIDESNLKNLIIQVIKEEGLTLFNWDKKAILLKQRVDFLNYNDKTLGFASFDEKDLLNDIEDWLSIYLNDIKSIFDLKKLDLYSILINRLSWKQQKELDQLAPIYYLAASGSKIKIDYSNIKLPKLSIKIQEIFGTYDSIKILNNKIILQIELLSPALRPIQITNDLRSFWQNSYEEVRKELRGKYKKHYWPENPYSAQATNKLKKNMK
ncbi:ATP-dependent helicase HrpB [Malaciobacter molluscorum LMG 25693]|uniref:ATP-dependent helicase HrpB n=1 Tax=Malaciobacter molluscorum LMG 25693 TaxID=870501 RepID=A0A2G1DKR5_9BACT|nr:ATP-dependent helicase HrpB [Malaciobacter molluscorum]AXX92695.1 ATP-dependent helicase HrpB [Malaciobacter molluscorum LMG 25693]PHO19113.1 ATP-dependent helicase HrpB [Malaciobacter molluscorum LMG 25693]